MRDEHDSAAPQACAAASRRDALRLASGGLIVAASGLLIPGWLDNVEAAHPGQRIQHRAEKRRQRRRHRLNQRHRKGHQRTVGNKLHVRWIQFNVFNDRAVKSHQNEVTVTRYVDTGIIRTWWESRDSVVIANSTSKTIQFPGETKAGILLHYPDALAVTFIFAENTVFPVAPWVNVATGNYMSDSGIALGTTNIQGQIGIGETLYGGTYPWSFHITRRDDTADYQVFDVHFNLEE